MGNQILKQLITVSPGSTMTGLYWSQVRTNMDGFCSTVDVANMSEVFGQNYGSRSHLGYLSKVTRAFRNNFELPPQNATPTTGAWGRASWAEGGLTSGRPYLHHRT